MTKERLIELLKECELCGDTESGHCRADELLLEYINDEAIAFAYTAVPKWYA